MRINTVHVRNFRCIQDETLDCDALTVLVGRNGAGKSSFLRALDLFYSPAAKYTQDDFYGGDTDRTISIEVRFENLSARESDLLAAYTDNNTLTVVKELTWPVGRASQKRLANTRIFPRCLETWQEPGSMRR
jgi:predicted ATP-dependent endonuclease of OLD family